VEKTVAVVAAARDMPAGTLLRKGDLKTVTLLEKEIPKTAIREERLAINRPLLFPVTANEPLTGSKIAAANGIEGLAATIEIGMRAITVPITDTNSVAGLIPPRAHVDVLFTRPGSTSEAVTSTILEDVIVLAIGRATEAPSSSTTAKDAASQAPRAAVQSATLLATPEQTRMIELAKNLGKISLALRNPLDQTQASDDTATTPQDIGLFPPPPPVRTTIVKQPPVEPKPKVPPKTRLVEVFHGSTHVQEAFK